MLGMNLNLLPTSSSSVSISAVLPPPAKLVTMAFLLLSTKTLSSLNKYKFFLILDRSLISQECPNIEQASAYWLFLHCK